VSLGNNKCKGGVLLRSVGGAIRYVGLVRLPLSPISSLDFLVVTSASELQASRTHTIWPSTAAIRRVRGWGRRGGIYLVEFTVRCTCRVDVDEEHTARVPPSPAVEASAEEQFVPLLPGFTVLSSSPVLTPRTRTNLPPSPQPPTPPMTV
jgi:hypothetical protein